MIFVSYLTDFSYLLLERNCGQLLHTELVKNGPFVKDGFRYFSLIFSYFIFYPESSLYISSLQIYVDNDISSFY